VTGDKLVLAIPPELVDAVAARAAEIVMERLGEFENGGSPWMTAAEAADYLRWPVKRIYNLTGAGAIPHRKHEGRVLFHRAELDGWLDRHREGRS
jgi:excisionase family DNA binding protein